MARHHRQHARRVRSPDRVCLLRAFFERGGFAAQMREDFASEMQRAGDQNRIRVRARKHRAHRQWLKRWSGEWWSNDGEDFVPIPPVRHGPFTADFRQDHRTGNRRERFADTAQIFVGKNREHERRFLITKNFAPRLRQNARRAADYARRR